VAQPQTNGAIVGTLAQQALEVERRDSVPAQLLGPHGGRLTAASFHAVVEQVGGKRPPRGSIQGEQRHRAVLVDPGQAPAVG
jgi:hypothetical protein